jgi:hypothetical protein
MLTIRESSGHSSHQKSSDSSDCPETHVNRSVNCKSGEISLRRVNWISNSPDLVEHRDASASRTPLHVLCSSRASEMRTSRNDKTGLQSWPAAACVALNRARLAASKMDGRERRTGWISFRLLMTRPLCRSFHARRVHSGYTRLGPLAGDIPRRRRCRNWWRRDRANRSTGLQSIISRPPLRNSHTACALRTRCGRSVTQALMRSRSGRTRMSRGWSNCTRRQENAASQIRALTQDEATLSPLVPCQLALCAIAAPR